MLLFHFKGVEAKNTILSATSECARRGMRRRRSAKLLGAGSKIVAREADKEDRTLASNFQCKTMLYRHR